MDHADSFRLSPRPRRAPLSRAQLAVPAPGAKHVQSAPEIRRGTMVPVPWVGFTAGLLNGMQGLFSRAKSSEARAAWEIAATRRRQVLLALVLASSGIATYLMAEARSPSAHPLLEAAQLSLFGLLFAWVSAGFYTAMMGVYVQLRGDKHGLSAASVARDVLRADARTAVIMPICNEHVSTVFAGLRATCESLATTGASRLFDVFVLSDTSDPELRAAELAAWAELRETLGDDRNAPRVHYRWRQRRTRRKAGNVADFCRRWGRNYRYMVVLDADSVMSGDALVTLAKLMEAHPKAGIIQTAPQAAGLSTLHARAQQFSGRVTGQLFTSGMQYWQLGESHYWGHNAIIRVEPFMKHCALAPLKGKGGLSGDIMSHDFVEAALMRRAGFEVWLVPDLAGSYEQQPPDLLEELQRDRRWCQGNLQNARLITQPGLSVVHRAMLLTGAMAYVSAPLWLLFIIVGALAWVAGGVTSIGELPSHKIALWGLTLTMLLLPRALAVATVVGRREQRLYGGTATLLKGAFVEASLSVLQAPIRMVGHTIFVTVALTGLKLDWKSPPREASMVAWRDAARRFGPAGLLAAAAIGVALWVDAGAAMWLLPVGLPLMLAIPLAVATSHAGLGERLRAKEWLTTPEESVTPTVLRHAWTYARRASPPPKWHEVVSNPWLFDVVRAAMGPRNTASGSRGRVRREWLRRVAREKDQLVTLPPVDRMRLLSEPQTIADFQYEISANARSIEPPQADGVRRIEQRVAMH